MLPFLQDKKRFVTAVMGKRNEHNAIEIGPMDEDPSDSKMEAASYLMAAFHSNNIEKLKQALEYCFEVYDVDEDEQDHSFGGDEL